MNWFSLRTGQNSSYLPQHAPTKSSTVLWWHRWPTAKTITLTLTLCVLADGTSVLLPYSVVFVELAFVRTSLLVICCLCIVMHYSLVFIHHMYCCHFPCFIFFVVFCLCSVVDRNVNKAEGGAASIANTASRHECHSVVA